MKKATYQDEQLLKVTYQVSKEEALKRFLAREEDKLVEVSVDIQFLQPILARSAIDL